MGTRNDNAFVGNDKEFMIRTDKLNKHEYYGDASMMNRSSWTNQTNGMGMPKNAFTDKRRGSPIKGIKYANYGMNKDQVNIDI